jgi:RimJ/RimL family protein N-acetyltransferase
MTGGFATERLRIRDLAEDDLERIFDVYASNQAYLELTSGASGEPGRFDLDMLRRDFAVARAMPGRHMAGVYLEDSDEPIGVLDWMEQNPSDRKPWLGLVLVRADRHGQGIAREVVEGLVAHLRSGGADAMRAAVIARNQPALAFVRALGFESVFTTTKRLATEEEMLVFERRL